MKYEIIKVLGEGGYGNVFLVKNQKNDFFAMKIIKKQSTFSESENAYRKMISLGNTEYLVEILDYRKLKQPVVKMEYYPHPCLYFVKLKNVLNLFSIVDQIIKGMVFLHNNMIVHRDLKMENILVDKDFHIKIIDYGLAIDLTSLDKNNRKLLNIAGTPKYMPPEAIDFSSEFFIKKEIYTLKTLKYLLFKWDSWSLGCLMTFLFSKKFPYEGHTYKDVRNVMATENFKLGKFIFDMDKVDRVKIKKYIKHLLDKNPFTRKKISSLKM